MTFLRCSAIAYKQLLTRRWKQTAIYGFSKLLYGENTLDKSALNAAFSATLSKNTGFLCLMNMLMTDGPEQILTVRILSV